MKRNKTEEPLWCRLYKEQIIRPKQRERITERFGRTKKSQAGFYNSKAWQTLREWFISEHPICAECEKEGRVRPTKIVDHIKPVDLYPELALSCNNLQSLCDYHHIRKTNEDKKQRKLIQGSELMKQIETKPHGGG